MPRSSVALTAEPLTGDRIVAAAGRVWTEFAANAEPLVARSVDDGAVLQLVAGDEVVLSVLRPRLLLRLGEVARLLPGTAAPEGTRWWAEAYTPWQGAIGLTILDAAAAASGGIAVHQDPPPTR